MGMEEREGEREREEEREMALGGWVQRVQPKDVSSIMHVELTDWDAEK